MNKLEKKETFGFQQKLKKDAAGYLWYKLYYFRIKIDALIHSFYYKHTLHLKGIKTGKNCIFVGKSMFLRFPLSNIEIGENCTFRSDKISNLIGVNRNCIISTHSDHALIMIGEGCGLSGVSIGAYDKIVLGKNVLCGANSILTDFDWHDTVYPSAPKPVIIHDNVWLGVNTVVLKGVEIGKNTIIGANSVVAKSIPANVVAAGNPCKIIKYLD
jgi:acetyltransferase-like isoleucine patch superfamily enzyme